MRYGNRYKILLITHIYPYTKEPNKGMFVKDFVEQMRKAGNLVEVCVVRQKILYPFIMPLKIAYKLISLKPDIIHAQFGVPSGFIASLFCKNIPVVVTIHRIELYHFLLKPFIPFTIKHTGLVICVSEEIKDRIQNIRKNPVTNKLRVIYNAVDSDYIKMISNSNIREKYNIPTNSVIITAIGWFEPRKNFNLLIKAFERIPMELNGFLVIAGKGKCRNELIKLIKEYRLGERIALIGEVGGYNKLELLAESEIFVLPSSSEGHSIALLEAMASENVVVCSEIKTFKETIENGVDGFVVPIDKNAFANKIAYLLRNSNLRKEIGRAARKKVIAQFSWKRRIENILNIYKELIIDD